MKSNYKKPVSSTILFVAEDTLLSMSDTKPTLNADANQTTNAAWSQEKAFGAANTDGEAWGDE